MSSYSPPGFLFAMGVQKPWITRSVYFLSLLLMAQDLWRGSRSSVLGCTVGMAVVRWKRVRRT